MLLDIIRKDFHAGPGLASLEELVAPSFFVDVGPSCNFRCLYCSVERNGSFHPADELCKTVELGGRHGLGCGFFTGGEPSLYPHLERVMEHGNAHGVPHWGITTNGWGLADRARVLELHRLGMRLWQLSWDDFRPEVLDLLRGHRGVQPRLVEALEAIDALPEGHVSLYMVVARQNLEILPDMVGFTAGLRERHSLVKSLHISMLKPVSYALQNPQVLFPMEQATPYIRRTIEQSRKLNLPIWFNHLPGCLIPDEPDYHYASFERQGRYETDTARELPPTFQENRLVKPAACLGCTRYEVCTGAWKAYIERFGDEAFRPTGPLVRAAPLEPGREEEGDPGAGGSAPPRDAPRHHEVHVGFACCYRCVFCPSAAPGHHRRRAGLDEVIEEIEHAARQGASSINFSGGEPSIHPRVPEMVRRAGELGFGTIGMITNGRGLVEEAKLKHLCDLGLNQVGLSVHSHTAALEDRITGVPGSFASKTRAMDNLVRVHRDGLLPRGFSVKTVLQRRILGRLDELVAFFLEHGVRDIGFNFIRPDHRARNKQWVPRLSDTTPRLRELVVLNESSLGANLAFLDIPFCKLPWELLSVPSLGRKYLGINRDRDITIFLSEHEGGRKRIAWEQERKNVMKTHPPACATCPLRDRCEGIWRGYIDIHGPGEFDAGPGVVEASLSRGDNRPDAPDTRAFPW